MTGLAEYLQKDVGFTLTSVSTVDLQRPLIMKFAIILQQNVLVKWSLQALLDQHATLLILCIKKIIFYYHVICNEVILSVLKTPVHTLLVIPLSDLMDLYHYKYTVLILNRA